MCLKCKAFCSRTPGNGHHAAGKPRNYFVNKGRFITQVLRDAAPVLLFPRPRRFGKTLNLTMLKAILECDVLADPHADADGNSVDTWPHRPAFDGLQVMRDEEIVARHAGQYPVIYLTFNDIKKTDWNGYLQGMLRVLANEIRRHIGECDLQEAGKELRPQTCKC